MELIEKSEGGPAPQLYLAGAILRLANRGPERRCVYVADLFEFPGRHAVDAGFQQDLAMLPITDVAPVLARPFQRTLSPGRQTGAIRPAVGTCRRALGWLALRGSPPGNRALPDIASLVSRNAEGVVIPDSFLSRIV
jgi:hypothetical protein